MSEYVFKLPDLGEGTVEAEIVEWHVEPGDRVNEGDIIADVMTDKANVEMPSPVTGSVLRTTGEPGDLVPVGSELIAFEVAGDQPQPAPVPEPAVQAEQVATTSPDEPIATSVATPTPEIASESAVPRREGIADRVRTSPAVRRRAKEAGIELSQITGTGPGGRILRQDLEAVLSGQTAQTPPSAAPVGVGEIEEFKVIGVRRVIANRMQASKREIPHFAYVEEVDITRLESLRTRLNTDRESAPSLTYLPFIGMALVRALTEYPQCNAHFDSETGMLKRFKRVHLGIATQTPDGLKVPVVHNADTLSLWRLAGEITRVSAAARDNTATRQELTGSTITLTSLGRLGGIASTPVINAPEVAIIGVNKAIERPVAEAGEVVVRLMMNLSSSFDHRFVDGFDAASLIQRVKAYLEEPATIFIE